MYVIFQLEAAIFERLGILISAEWRKSDNAWDEATLVVVRQASSSRCQVPIDSQHIVHSGVMYRSIYIHLS